MKGNFLPITREEMKERGWDQVDFVYVSGDAYVDHPSFGHAIITRLLESRGYRVGIIAQPDWRKPESVQVFGEPRLGFLVSAGNMDSMVNHYSVSKKRRKTDAYTPGGEMGKRPDYACVVYGNLIRQTYKKTPIILGGIEASLRRMAHYDYWSDKLKRSVLLDSGADVISYGMGEHSIIELAEALDAGIPVEDITYIAGTVVKTKSLDSIYDAEILPAGLQTSLVEKMDDGRFLVFIPVRVSKTDRAEVSARVASLPRIIVADPFYYAGKMVSIIHDDFNVILMISSLFVLLVLLLSFRNVLVALIAFMPMFFSWYIVEGIMALCGIQFNLINIVISTFIFGIRVDYSIFVMEGLLTEARTGTKNLLESHKMAIFFSAFVLMVVVVALLFAKHPSIHSIGVSTLIGMAATILITYTLEPFLFRQFMKWKRFRNKVVKH